MERSQAVNERIAELGVALEHLAGTKIPLVAIPRTMIGGFEPSQIAVIVNTALDGSLHQLEKLGLAPTGLGKHKGTEGDREGYPDYDHRASDSRVELKGLFVDNPDLGFKRTKAAREASARLKEEVRVENVDPERDVLAVVAYRLEPDHDDRCEPTILEVGLFPVIDCIEARDERLIKSGGKWSADGKPLVKTRKRTDESVLGKDRNFGKLDRIPYRPLEEFLERHGYRSKSRDA